MAVTLDLEMSRNFPTWETVHWDYEKGNLNEPTKQYTVEASRRVKAQGGVLHSFVVGRVLEQEDVGWLKGIAAAGHPLGNHTYDHVNIKATRLDEVQVRFRRAPWLVSGRKPAEVIAENIRLTTAAMRERLGVTACGFRTPGGYRNGLADRPDVQAMLQSLGFDWVSSMTPSPGPVTAEAAASSDMLDRIVRAQADAQPRKYPSGLIEVPMSPLSDIHAFRVGRWKLDDFVRSVRAGLAWAIREHACYDLLMHPSCMYVVDPEFRVIDTVLEMVQTAGDAAAIVDLRTIALRASQLG